MDELIRKQDAIKAICEDGTWLESQGCTEITMAERKQRDADILSDLPPIQPKRGKWKDGKCDQCSGSAPFWPLANTYYCSNFCPHCGADMRGEADG